ncbi:MAG: LysM peptidoglycan-binding domain-containing protein [Clostridia bacterium]|nr:LysM peptidoglycan-binding domain-containing protein [Clostridia bacterium]
MKIKNRKKFILSVSILALIMIFTILLTKHSFSHVEIKTKILYISSGDTLWDIAVLEQNTNEYYKNKKVGQIVEDIKYKNNLNSSYIYEGQKIEIPVYE